ncbi:Phospholipase [Brachionus plicatilis]|uniref:Phospholipase n=1 Tax=Brachionus plicatilis TaxID=10195 RepID=A0A3M7SES9_BRAPC|nr:Phospholipase [Brachionus plicatilis]
MTYLNLNLSGPSITYASCHVPMPNAITKEIKTQIFFKKARKNFMHNKSFFFVKLKNLKFTPQRSGLHRSEILSTFDINNERSKSFTKTGVKIRRGQKEKHKESDSEEKLPEITHLVFVVHGIAQKLYENSVIKNCEDLRKECEKKKKEFFENSKNERFVFLPVDWRSSLILDDGIVESITPKSIQAIRDKLNSSALDIMYYTSPLYRTESQSRLIMTSLTNEMNRLYNLFCEKNPTFKRNHNKVSLIAHSLGSVIVYDIIIANTSFSQMTNNYGEDSSQQKLVLDHLSQNDAQLLDQYLEFKQKLEDVEKKMIKANNSTGLLAFKPQNFFLLGSPIAVFLALRGVRPAGLGSQDHILPKNICKKLFNIFHPSDPIAYRLEPLVLKHYATKSPVEIMRSSDPGCLKLSYKELNAKRNPISSDLKTALAKNPVAKKKDKNDSKSVELNQFKEDTKSTNSLGDSMDQVELEDALDYQLSESNFELMAALKAHTCYWKSSDTALFIVQNLITNDNDSSRE